MSNGPQIRYIEQNGFTLNPKSGPSMCHSFKFFFVGDLKILYSMFGMSGARGAHPCIWCLWPNRVMGLPSDIALAMTQEPEREPRPEIQNLTMATTPVYCNCTTKHVIQKIGTDNFLGLPFDRYLIPALHVHLGIVNKVLEVFDFAHAMVDACWSEKRRLDSSEMETDENFKPARAHLAHTLTANGIRRDRYYAGTLSGVPGTRFLRPARMLRIVTAFFEKEVQYSSSSRESISDCLIDRLSIPRTHVEQVKEALTSLAEIYGSDDKHDSEKSLRALMQTNRKWTPHDFDTFQDKLKCFADIFDKTLTRKESSSRDLRVPMFQPKWYIFTVHLIQQARRFSSLSILSEEGMEHLQQLSLKFRDFHSSNLPLGRQIQDNLSRSFLYSSTLVARIVGGIEVIRKANGKKLRKLEFFPSRVFEVPEGEDSSDEDGDD